MSPLRLYWKNSGSLSSEQNSSYNSCSTQLTHQTSHCHPCHYPPSGRAVLAWTLTLLILIWPRVTGHRLAWPLQTVVAQRAVVAGRWGRHLALWAVVASVTGCGHVGVGCPSAVVARCAGQAVGDVGVTWQNDKWWCSNQQTATGRHQRHKVVGQG